MAEYLLNLVEDIHLQISRYSTSTKEDKYKEGLPRCSTAELLEAKGEKQTLKHLEKHDALQENDSVGS